MFSGCVFTRLPIPAAAMDSPASAQMVSISSTVADSCACALAISMEKIPEPPPIQHRADAGEQRLLCHGHRGRAAVRVHEGCNHLRQVRGHLAALRPKRMHIHPPSCRCAASAAAARGMAGPARSAAPVARHSHRPRDAARYTEAAVARRNPSRRSTKPSAASMRRDGPQCASIHLQLLRQCRGVLRALPDSAAKVPTSSATDITGKWNNDSQLSQMMRSSTLTGGVLTSAAGCGFFPGTAQSRNPPRGRWRRSTAHPLRPCRGNDDLGRDDRGQSACDEFAGEDHEACHRGQHAGRRGLPPPTGPARIASAAKLNSEAENGVHPQRGSVHRGPPA